MNEDSRELLQISPRHYIQKYFINKVLRNIIVMDSCIQGALADLDSIIRELSDFHYLEWSAGVGLSLVRTYCALGRIWGEGLRCESALLSLEETVYKCSLEIHILYLTLREKDDPSTFKNFGCFLFEGVPQLLHHIRMPVFRGVEELHQSLYDCAILQRSSSFPIEMEELLSMLDSLVHNLVYVDSMLIPELSKNLEFLKNLILFAKFRGLEHMQMRDMFIHVQHLAVDVASLIFKFSDCPHEDEVGQLVEKILPVECHVCEIYVHLLWEALKSSKVPNHATPGSHTLILDMVDSLVFLLLELSLRDNSYMGMFDHQINILQEGLRFLIVTLRVQHDKLDELYEEMHNFIGVLICEATMIVCYLFVRKRESCIVEQLQHLFFNAGKKFKIIKETLEVPRSPLRSTSYFPQTNLLGFIDFVLEKMEPINVYEAESVLASEENKFVTVHDDLAFLRSFLVNYIGRQDQNVMVQTLWSRVTAVVYETEYVLDSLMVGGSLQRFSGMLNTIIEQIMLIKTETLEVSRSVGQITKVQKISKTHMTISFAGIIPGFNEPVVGLDDETQRIIDRLMRGTKQLDVVSIVGMAGLGKTTLAKKVFRDLSIVHYFRVHAWCTISQVYDKRSLLLEIISVLDNGYADNHSSMSEDDLANALRRLLKRKAYLIVLDDVWDIEAWHSLKISFPDDANGSRILLTSRNENVALQIKSQSQPHHLRMLTSDESLELFHMKICSREGYPSEFLVRAKAITQCCKGLPLKILIVAGLLSSMETSRWEEVIESLKKSSAPTIDHCKETLELSYHYLPEYLKQCFLYFGAYKEDERVRVRDLSWLWIAEGFVDKTPGGCMEDVAQGYLMELIQRNLVMVAERGSRGKVKFCILHDLLHEFCMGKSIGDNFLNRLSGSELGSSTEPNMSYRLLIYSRGVEDFAEPLLVFPYLRTLFIVVDHKTFDYKTREPRAWYSILYKLSQSKLLRVLGLRSICEFRFFPSVIQILNHLKYLTFPIQGDFAVPPSIATLSNLEMLAFYGRHGHNRIFLPNSVWKMKTLRHLHTVRSEWILPVDDSEDPSILDNLQSFSIVRLSKCRAMKEIIWRFPNIRVFKCVEVSKNIELDFLSQLESLSICGQISFEMRKAQLRFPQNLKKLQLQLLFLPWSKMSTLDRLPNLEVLKLQYESFIGGNWDMEEGTFPKLRFLKLQRLDLARWTDSDDNFPCLEKLVLKSCTSLEELPSCLVDIPTLRMIEVFNCDNAIDSIRKIQETQKDFGNEDLEIRIHH